MTFTPLQEKAKKFCEALIAKYKGNEPFKGEDGEYHYIYLTILKHNHKFYIGKHSSKDYTIDPYTGSGKWYKNALKHHGIDAIEHYRLCFFPTSDEAYAKEAEEVTLEMIENTFKRQIYNLKAGGFGGKLSKESRDRLADSLRARVDYILTRGAETKTVNKDELIPLLQKEEGWKITSHKQIQLHHANVAGSTIVVVKETGFMEEDILDALEAFGEENFILGKAPAGHQTTADEKTVEKVKKYIEFVKKRGKQRMADAIRASTSYTLKKGDEPPLGFNRYEVLGKLKEDYRFTIGSVQICKKGGTDKPHYFESKHQKYDRELQHQKLIRLLESGLWQIGCVWEEPEEGLLQLEGLSPSILNGWARDSYKVLIDKEGKEHEVFNTEVLGKLKEDYRFTQKGIDICNKAGTVKPHVFESKHYKYDRELQHQKLIRLLESGLWQVGSVWEEPEDKFLVVEGLSPSILNGWAKGSYKVLIDKEGNEHEVFNTEVLGKLKEDYRFTQKEISICNKAGTVKPHRFESTTIKATREERHLKLIGLLESGDWQVGSVWEELVVTEVVEEPAVVGEPVVAEIEELVEANPVVGEPVVQSAWGEMINFFDSFKDLPITRKTRYTI